jgi:hypothetical protein
MRPKVRSCASYHVASPHLPGRSFVMSSRFAAGTSDRDVDERIAASTADERRRVAVKRGSSSGICRTAWNGFPLTVRVLLVVRRPGFLNEETC